LIAKALIKHKPETNRQGRLLPKCNALQCL